MSRDRRERMVDRQVAARNVRDPQVLRALRRVPRERFVPAAQRADAYDDRPLAIGEGQTISQPYIVGLMLQAARIGPGDKVLEIGAGSGYAAAVMAELAGQVHAVERLSGLADSARARLARSGYSNVVVHHGDGSRGWPSQAPYDAILAAAGGPRVPEELKQQLAPGGRLVMPVGPSRHEQRLVCITRGQDDHFSQVDLGGVRFVPLLGEGGWSEEEPASDRSPRPPRESDAVAALKERGETLDEIDHPGFAAPFDRYSGNRVLLLGECSHGTSEFYRARAAITRRMIERHGLRIVAIEADWPDAAILDRYVRHARPDEDEPKPFARFPTWMWRNQEFAAFVAWVREFNASRDPVDRVGIFGLDLYSLERSMRVVIDYLESVDPEAAADARSRYGCLAPWAAEPAGYGRLAHASGYARCEGEVLEMLQELLSRRLEYSRKGAGAFFDAEHNARLVSKAEAYYRAMYRGGAEAWNIRDRHMAQTLASLMHNYEGSAAVVWAHNSHVGDARETEMGRARGELNLGQLCRERWPGETAIIGFGTHSGTVAAANDWDAPMQCMPVQPSLEESVEHLFHRAGQSRLLADLREDAPARLHEPLKTDRLQRYIGVVYRPRTERASHYMPACLSRQYDGYVWFARTRAVAALPTRQRPGVPDTYPFGN